MRFELVLGLLSSFQIYHQSMSNSLATLDFGYSTLQLSLVSAIFPVGKFVGTVCTIALLHKNYSNRQCLDYSATLLIFGASAMLLPSFVILCLSRFVIGVGVGIAFISAFVALSDFSNFAAFIEEEQQLWTFRLERRKQRRLSAFFGTAALFAAATAFANISVFFRVNSHFMQICVFALPAIFSGLNYFWYRDTVEEQFPALLPDHPMPATTNVRMFRKTSPQHVKLSRLNPFLSVHATLGSSADDNRITLGDELVQQTVSPVFSRCHLRADSSALTLAIALMSINASIGVPIVLAFSSIIYRSLGVSVAGAQYLSVAYPLIQLGIMLTLQRWMSVDGVDVYSGETSLRFITKRDIILVGYAICLACMFLLLLTLGFHTLDADPAAKKTIASIWSANFVISRFTLLAIASAPPCNAGAAVIATELFSNRKKLIEGMALSRAFFWIFSSVLCGAFLRILESADLFFAFSFCFVASIVVFTFLVIRLPHGALNADVVDAQYRERESMSSANASVALNYAHNKCFL